MKKYKKILIIITIVSFIGLMLCYTNPIKEYINNIVLSLCINVLSSVLIIWFIDLKMDEQNKKQLEERRTMIYKQLVPIIERYQNFIINLYKATTLKDEIDRAIFQGIRGVNDRIIERFKLIDLDAEGHLADIINNKNYKWKEIIMYQTADYIRDIENIYNNYSSFFSNKLSELMLKIISLSNYSVHKNKNILFICMNMQYDADTLIRMMHIEKICNITKSIIEEIKDYVEITKLNINERDYLNDEFSYKFNAGRRK